MNKRDWLLLAVVAVLLPTVVVAVIAIFLADSSQFTPENLILWNL